MHDTSRRKMEAYRREYLTPDPGRPVRVLDIGSKSYGEHDTYRPLFGAGYEYVGLDLVEGPNVDVVPADLFRWGELDDASFDAVISGQTFEHNPYPWITMAEVARVLRPGGTVCLIVPSSGVVHRYPLDCWRFYPDAGSALCTYVGLDLLESSVEGRGRRAAVDGAVWGDFFLVARRPEDLDIDRLRIIVSTVEGLPSVVPGTDGGRALGAYEDDLPSGPGHVVMHWIGRGANKARHLVSRTLGDNEQP